MEPLNEQLWRELCESGEDFNANDNISWLINELSADDYDEWRRIVEDKAEDFLRSLLINTVSDENTKDTAHRLTKMYIDEVFAGRYIPPPDVKAFPNEKQYDQIYLTGPIDIRSTCAHHFQPIQGSAWVGIFPGKKVLGLSKFNRLIDHVASRPQIQEDMTEQIGNLIEKEIDAKGVAVIIKASHFCVTHRGVKAHASDMTTSVMRGVFRDDPSMKAEFFELVKGMKGYQK